MASAAEAPKSIEQPFEQNDGWMTRTRHLSRVIYVGTGSYLGNTDLSSTATQSIYAFKDPGTGYGDIRKSGVLV